MVQPSYPAGEEGDREITLATHVRDCTTRLATLLFLSCFLFLSLFVCFPAYWPIARKVLNIFREEIGFLVWLLFSSEEIVVGRWYVQGFLVWLLFSSEEIVVGRWYVQHAAIWQRYLPSCLYIKKKIRSIPFLFSFFFLKSGIDKSGESPRY